MKNSRHGLDNPNARYRKENSRRGRAGQPGGRRSAAAARHLRDVRRRGRADRGEQVVRREAPRLGRRACRRCGRSVDRHAAATRSTCPNCPTSPPTPPRRCPRPTGCSRTRSSTPPTPRPASAPRTCQPGRGLRPVDRAGTRLVRAPRTVRQGRGRAAAAQRRHHDRRPHPGQPVRRAGLLRRGHPRPGHRPGLRAHLAAARARPPAARSRAPRSASPPTRDCSATARR